MHRWVEKDLPSAVRGRRPPHMSGAELSKLITWKLRVCMARLSGVDRHAHTLTGLDWQ